MTFRAFLVLTFNGSSCNLVEADVDALVNTVNAVGVMGKCIALQFKNAFPANFKAYERACKDGRVRLGEMFVVDAGQLMKLRWIINFPTKGHWRSRSKRTDIETGLDDLRRVIVDLGIKSIALPPLGCGNGGGNKVLHNVLGGHIGVFEGNGGDLRIGLPMQSLHDGNTLSHRPLRLSVVIKAPAEFIDAVIAAHQVVQDLVRGKRLHLLRIDPQTGSVARRPENGWRRSRRADLVLQKNPKASAQRDAQNPDRRVMTAVFSPRTLQPLDEHCV